MAGTYEPVCAAVNVMWTRLTILGFHLAVVTFPIYELQILGGGR